MSEWHNPKDDDIDIDIDTREVNIFVKQNDFGSVNISLSYKQIKEIAEKIGFKIVEAQ